MATKRGGVMGLRVRPEDWELFTQAARHRRTRSGCIERPSSTCHRALVKQLQEALRETDRVNRAARKLADGHAGKHHAAIVHSGIVYEDTLAPVADAPDALAASFAPAKASAKPSGKKQERSPGQIRKLSRLPEGWQA